MRHGQIVEAAPAERLFDDPEHEYTKMLLSSTVEDAPRRQLTLAAITASAKDDVAFGVAG